MRVAFLGATQGMGRALSRRMASRGDALVLLGHLEDELQKSVADLQARGTGPDPTSFHCDLEKPETFGPALEHARQHMGGLDCVVVTAGLFGTQERLEGDLEFTGRLLRANFVNAVLFCEHARPHLLADGGGTLCVFSSVAGERGRKPVALYGSSKAGLSCYLEAMDHKYRADGLATVTVKPGFVKTGMTEGLKPPPFAGEPEAVAERVLSAIEKQKPVVYVPAPWALIMMVIRNLPRFVMRKINF